LQDRQRLQGSYCPFFLLVQFSAFAKSRAMVVFPVPRGPENKYACEIRFKASALVITLTT